MKCYTIFSAFLLMAVLTGCTAAESAPMGASAVSGEVSAESAESAFDISSAPTAGNTHDMPREIITAEPESIEAFQLSVPEHSRFGGNRAAADSRGSWGIERIRSCRKKDTDRHNY